MSALTRPRHALLSLIQTNNSKSSWLRHLHSALGPARDLLAAMEALEHQLPPGINTISKPATWSPCRKALIRAYQERALILQQQQATIGSRPKLVCLSPEARPYWAKYPRVLFDLPWQPRNALLRLKCSTHNLNVEVGRRSDTPFHRRVCRLCRAGIETEEHPLVCASTFASEARRDLLEAARQDQALSGWLQSRPTLSISPADALPFLFALLRSEDPAIVRPLGYFYLAIFKRLCNGKHI
jgi:hypothetical protein